MDVKFYFFTGVFRSHSGLVMVVSESFFKKCFLILEPYRCEAVTEWTGDIYRSGRIAKANVGLA